MHTDAQRACCPAPGCQGDVCTQMLSGPAVLPPGVRVLGAHGGRGGRALSSRAPPCRYEAELSPVEQKLSALRSPLAQRPFLEAPGGLGTVELYEYECGGDDLPPS